MLSARTLTSPALIGCLGVSGPDFFVISGGQRWVKTSNQEKGTPGFRPCHV